MKIQHRDDLPPAQAYWELFETTGWNKVYKATADELHKAVRQSWCIVSAYESDRLVGFGRVVSDGVLYAMIYDLIVLPSHQRRGIGSEILKRIIDTCRSGGIRERQLFSAIGMSEFYRKHGFEERPPGAPGMRLTRQLKSNLR